MSLVTSAIAFTPSQNGLSTLTDFQINHSDLIRIVFRDITVQSLVISPGELILPLQPFCLIMSTFLKTLGLWFPSQDLCILHLLMREVPGYFHLPFLQISVYLSPWIMFLPSVPSKSHDSITTFSLHLCSHIRTASFLVSIPSF